MNRIYQGRVTKVEILKGKDGKPEPLPDWQQALLMVAPKRSEGRWQHHQLFQETVNYYTLALAALA
jgi:hypothetical protein